MLINSLILKEDGVHPGGGLGDYIRGSLACYQFAKTYNISFAMDLANHPISNYIIGHKITRYPKVISMFSWPKEQIENLIANHCYSENNPLVVYSNAVPRYPISNECKEYVRSQLTPIKQLEGELPVGNYHALHIRSGDNIGFSTDDSKVEELLNSIGKNIEEILKKTGAEKIITVSDSLCLKKLLKKRYNIEYMNTVPTHSELLTCNTYDLLIDFFTLQNSKHIYQFTNAQHYWGSGFSDSASWLRSVPVTKFKY